MLDLDHPMTDHIFAASRAEDRLSVLCKLMTLASAQERQRLFAECQEPLNSLRRLNAARFGASDFIADAVTELEDWLGSLAALETTPREGTAYAIVSCPVCGGLLTRLHHAFMPQPERRWSVYCNHCLGPSSPAWHKLESSQGFGTWAI